MNLRQVDRKIQNLWGEGGDQTSHFNIYTINQTTCVWTCTEGIYIVPQRELHTLTSAESHRRHKTMRRVKGEVSPHKAAVLLQANDLKTRVQNYVSCGQFCLHTLNGVCVCVPAYTVLHGKSRRRCRKEFQIWKSDWKEEVGRDYKQALGHSTVSPRCPDIKKHSNILI